MVSSTNALMDALTINAVRALAEFQDVWTTSIDIADTLQKDHQVPFRVGHAFASDVVGDARANGMRSKEFPYAKLVELFTAVLAKQKLPEAQLPLSKQAYRPLLSPADVVRTRAGVGGPQPTEVERMLASAQSQLMADKSWIQGARQKLKEADARLDAAFGKLATP